MFLYHIVPIEEISVFCMRIRTNENYLPLQHQKFGFYNKTGMFTAQYGLNLLM